MNITDTCVTASSYRCRLLPFGHACKRLHFAVQYAVFQGVKGYLLHPERLPFARALVQPVCAFVREQSFIRCKDKYKMTIFYHKLRFCDI